MGRRAGMVARAGGAALAATAMVLAGQGLAAAATSPTVVKELDLAGYHFTVSGSSVTAQGNVTMPGVSCGSGSHVFVPQVVVRYHAGTSLVTASAQFSVTCAFGVPVYGDPTLQIDGKTETGSHQLAAGETIGVTIKISASGGSVKVAYSKTSSNTLSGTGGRPYDVQYSVGLPSPPKYNPVKFTQCTTNGKTLASYKPGGWEAVNKSGQIIGKLSAISGGTSFTVSP